MAFDGNALRELAVKFLSLAERQRGTVPLMIGHRPMGQSLLLTGDIAQSRAQHDQAIALYDPTGHRSLATRFGQDARTTVLSWRQLALWLLGYPEAALADTEHALRGARTLTTLTHVCRRDRAAANAQANELISLAEEKGALMWKAAGMLYQGYLLVLTGKSSNAVEMITAGINAYQSTEATMFTPWYLSYLASAYADLGQFDEAWRSISEAMATMETTKERWCEAEIHRVAGEIALSSTEPDMSKAEPISRARSRSRVRRRQGPGNCARR